MVGYGVSLGRQVSCKKKYEKKIHVILGGTLGEQMFQCAKGIALSTEFRIPVDFSLQKGVKRSFFDSYFHLLKRGGVTGNIQISYEHKDKGVVYTIEDSPIVLSGLYQSETHFIKSISRVLPLIKLPIKYQTRLNIKYKEVVEQKNSVSIRINKKNNGNPPLSMDYYERACSKFSPKQVFVVITDDVVWCQQMDLFKSVLQNVIYVTGETDFGSIYMENTCTHHILSNSLDSWWAAYLDRGVRARVIAPSVWYYNDDDFNDGFIPKKWTIM
jgi:hypothetical protein